MEDIRRIREVPCVNSVYIRPYRVLYEQNGVSKTWDCVQSHDCVSCLVYNKRREKLIFVEQFRPPIYISRVRDELRRFREIDEKEACVIDTKRFPPSLGIVLELCMGMVDKLKSAEEIIKDELLEELGYLLELNQIEKVASWRVASGVEGYSEILYYVTVEDEQQVASGGGCEEEGEIVKVVEKSLDEARNMIFDESITRTPSLLFGLMWFFNDKLAKLKEINK